MKPMTTHVEDEDYEALMKIAKVLEEQKQIPKANAYNILKFAATNLINSFNIASQMAIDQQKQKLEAQSAQEEK